MKKLYLVIVGMLLFSLISLNYTASIYADTPHGTRNPDADVHILNRDMQMYGTENEKMLWDARGKGIKFDVYE